MSIIGSDSKNTSGDLYALDVNLKIGTQKSKQLKRIFDVLAALFLLFSLAIIIWFVANKSGFIANIFTVLSGKKSWVAYIPNESKQFNLPKIKNGVLNPIIASKIKNDSSLNIDRLNLIYAKNYSIEKDFIYLLKGIKFLGN